jgi:hypothetical protein
MEAIVSVMLAACAVYALIGLVFGLWFVGGAARRLDPAPMTAAARLAILPGAAALWPLLLPRTLGADGASPAPEQTR